MWGHLRRGGSLRIVDECGQSKRAERAGDDDSIGIHGVGASIGLRRQDDDVRTQFGRARSRVRKRLVRAARTRPEKQIESREPRSHQSRRILADGIVQHACRDARNLHDAACGAQRRRREECIGIRESREFGEVIERGPVARGRERDAGEFDRSRRRRENCASMINAATPQTMAEPSGAFSRPNWRRLVTCNSTSLRLVWLGSSGTMKP